MSVSRIVLSAVTGEDWQLTPDDEVLGWWPDNGPEGPVALSTIPAILAHPDGRITFVGWAGTVTLYGRGTAHVEVVP